MNSAKLMGPALDGAFGFRGTAQHYQLEPAWQNLNDVVISVVEHSRTGGPEVAVFPANDRGQMDGDLYEGAILEAILSGQNPDDVFPYIASSSPADLLAVMGYRLTADVGASGE